MKKSLSMIIITITEIMMIVTKITIMIVIIIVKKLVSNKYSL